jgi:uroporphyrinogen-III synthase
MRVLVGRARHQASALSVKLKSLGANVIEIPFIEIRAPRSFRPLDSALRNIATYDWLVLTSVNGAEALAARMRHLGIPPEEFRRVKIAAIGPATRNAIKRLRLKVSVVPKSYVAEAVVAALRGKVEGKKILLARAKVARDVIPRELRGMGALVDVVEAYQTVVPAASRQRLRSLMKSSAGWPDVITFTSSSTVKNFIALASGRRLPRRVKLACIGPITSATLRECDLQADIEAEEYTIPGLVKAIVAARNSS